MSIESRPLAPPTARGSANNTQAQASGNVPLAAPKASMCECDRQKRLHREDYAKLLLRGMSLAERVTVRGRTPPSSTDSTLGSADVDWRRNAGLEDDLEFEAWLASAGLSLSQFRDALSFEPESVHASLTSCPSWIWEIASALDEYADAEPMLVQDDGSFSITALVEPLIRAEAPRVQRALAEAQRKLAFDAVDPFEWFLSALHIRLSRILRPATHLAVTSVGETIAGAREQERSAGLFQNQRTLSFRAALVEKYPVLFRCAWLMIRCWSEASMEFLARLADDIPARLEPLGIGFALERISALDFYCGDLHDGGRSVIIVSFSSGAKVVYKPRSLRSAVAFADLVCWLNQHLKYVLLRAVRAVDCGEYGWAEFIETKDCHSRRMAKRFYRRQGAYLALFYLLSATDMHSENIIACGDHPVPVDLETVLPAEADPGSGVFGPEAVSYRTSVLRTGMLPAPIQETHYSRPVDMSALGARVVHQPCLGSSRGDQTPGNTPRLTARIARLPGLLLPADDCLSDLVRGFSEVYTIAATHREALFAELAHRFSGCRVRYVARSTSLYLRLLQQCANPPILQDAARRDMILAKLWSHLRQFPMLVATAPRELAALEVGDVPLFWATPERGRVHDRNGALPTCPELISGLAAVRRVLARLGPEDLQRQLWCIRAAFSRRVEDVPLSPTALEGARRPPLLARFKRCGSGDVAGLLATDIAGHILRRAPSMANDAMWLGILSLGGKGWAVRQLGTDLYDGLPGVALFLGCLNAADSNRYRAVARQCLEYMRTRTREGLRHDQRTRIVGLMYGASGYIYALSCLGLAWNSGELWDDAAAIAAELEPHVRTDLALDVADGVAGAALALSLLFQINNSSILVPVLRACGDRLLSTARKDISPFPWTTPRRSSVGFTHGVVGISLAMARLWEAVGDERYLAAALDALECLYDRTLAITGAARSANAQPGPSSWDDCDNSATGLAVLSLIRLLRQQSGCQRLCDQMDRDVRLAVATTLEHGFGANHSLFYGDLGHLHFILEARRVIGYPPDLDPQGVLRSVVADIHARGCVCATPKGSATPGFATGLSGIGYGLLCAAGPDTPPGLMLPMLSAKEFRM